MRYTYQDIMQAQKATIWSIGNQCLYELCSSYPLHNDKSVFLSKIWLIGRSYSASIERRKQNVNITNDAFYEDVIGEGLLKVGSKIDAAIDSLKEYERISSENLRDVLALHHFLTQTFENLTGMSKRSLASKYLHFHLPNLFYIYDTRANRSLAKGFHVERVRVDNLRKKLSLTDYDDEYAKFYLKMYLLDQDIEEKHGVSLSPRELDNLLLYAMTD